MASLPDTHFHCEVEELEVEGKPTITKINCHGRLVGATSEQFKQIVKPLIVRGSHLVLDFGDLAYIDSSGLGAVVGLKVSSISSGDSTLELVNLTPRVRELLSLTNLIQLFSIRPYPESGSAFAYHAEALSRPERETNPT